MTDLKKEIIEKINKLFPLSKEPVMLELAVEQALSTQKQEFEKMLDEVCRKGCPDIANLKARLKEMK